MLKPFASALILRHEERRKVVYLDSNGNPTGGIGHFDPNLIPGTVLTDQQIDTWWRGDFGDVCNALAHLPWINSLSGVRQAVIADMAFNMGVHGVCGFHDMIECLHNRDWLGASWEMLNAPWLKETKRRAAEDAAIMYYGLLPDWYKP